MDDPKEPRTEENGSKQTLLPTPAPPGIVQKVEPPPPEAEPGKFGAKAKEKNPPKVDRKKGIWSSEHLMLYLTVGIVLAAFLQFGASMGQWRAMRDQLGAMSEIADQDRRPWVGLQDFQCKDCTAGADGSLNIGDAFGVIANTGRTPATQMVVRSLTTTRKKSDPVPDIDALLRGVEDDMNRTRALPNTVPPDMADKIKKTWEIAMRDLSPAVVFPPNAMRSVPLIQRSKFGRDEVRGLWDRQLVYVLGKITYRDTRSIQHTTRFCFSNEFGAEFRFCPTGNDMD